MVGNVISEFAHSTAHFLIIVAFLKIVATYLIHRNASSSIGNGLGWFVPGVA